MFVFILASFAIHFYIYDFKNYVLSTCKFTADIKNKIGLRDTVNERKQQFILTLC